MNCWEYFSGYPLNLNLENLSSQRLQGNNEEKFFYFNEEHFLENTPNLTKLKNRLKTRTSRRKGALAPVTVAAMVLTGGADALPHQFSNLAKRMGSR